MILLLPFLVAVLQAAFLFSIQTIAAPYDPFRGLFENPQLRLYDQTLDHFNLLPESYTTFKQRYFIDSTYWGGANANAPILVYLGAESSLDESRGGLGFLSNYAARLKALVVILEHRYYGQSIPFGSRPEAFKNATTRGYLNSAQALADYAEILIHLKNELSAQYCPTIVVGGSYGGLLAFWFRLKFPHIALVALASSAPILYSLAPQDAIYIITENDFRETNELCYQTIRDSWSHIDDIAHQPNGLAFLSRRFRTCSPLYNSEKLKADLSDIYVKAAQLDAPSSHTVGRICAGIVGAVEGTDITGRIYGGLVGFLGNKSCYNIGLSNVDGEVAPSASETNEGWSWQLCSEFLRPIGVGEDSNVTMFERNSATMTQKINQCQSSYGVAPRLDWTKTFYGENDIKLILRSFASNVILSNGLRDPLSSSGMLEDISDTVVAVTTIEGSHCLDLNIGTPRDPGWLVKQRETEVTIIQKWIAKYYEDLKALKK